ncbi:hypothetical protein P691DRAFT_251987 [Macrolepiota fuliginosa MF-IS2]|uniref:Cyclase n=1 Tax=Macrolepiota fuliginosa MF-IS2 TaxID=1400762 RepID=A0A9P5X9G5_9AGAR|nr:hypothetical protein P691DRAFT_251987 [Macrolepiota fuliginosa MF-IS2]
MAPNTTDRLKSVVSQLIGPKKLPTFDELPHFKNFSGCAWGVWGPDDELGTVNLLTDEVVARTAAEEIRTGKRVSLNWPINFPERPLFQRKSPEVKMLVRAGSSAGMPRDDELHINTQSGTQWDGLRHYGVVEHQVFYNNTPAATLPLGINAHPNPTAIGGDHKKLGIQNWATHGICGRGVLLDIVSHYTKNGAPLPYDPWTTYAVTAPMLEAVAKAQGVKFRDGDVLLLRVGFMQKFSRVSQSERDALHERPETFAGIEQSEDMKRFLWNNHFAAVASDQPALEAWPARPGTQMHQTILGLWGMPIGEFFDLEQLSKVCADTGRYTFFFSSWPLNIIGGAASPPNAAVSIKVLQ